MFTHVTPSAAAEQTEQLCECSTYLATKFLNLFVKEGRLRALGRQNSRFYAPTPEGF